MPSDPPKASVGEWFALPAFVVAVVALLVALPVFFTLAPEWLTKAVLVLCMAVAAMTVIVGAYAFWWKWRQWRHSEAEGS